MRKIDSYFDEIPLTLQVANLTKKRKKNAAEKGEKRPERPSIIEEVLTNKRVESSSYNLDGVKIELLNKYGHTCAFCEKRVSHHDDIEHFRPKHEITEVKKISYYWLGFVWSNFLIACKECNSDFKRNHFPIENEDNRVLTPPVEDPENGYTNFMKCCRIDSPNLENEKPLLLHPVLDNPDEHLVFDKNGRVSAKNGSLKGQKSIEHYGLDNWGKRSILITDRGRIIEKVRNDVRTAVLNANDDKQLYKSILTIIVHLLEDLEIRKSNEKHVIQPHFAVRKACISQFESFFIDTETCYTEEQKSKLRDVLNIIKRCSLLYE